VFGSIWDIRQKLLSFNIGIVVKEIENFIREYFKKTGAKKLIIGLSGGVDSSTTLKLAVDSVGPRNVLALILPHYGITETSDIEDAYMVADTFGVEYITIELADICSIVKQRLSPFLDIDKKTYGNIIARLRMVTLYAFSNSMNGIVLGTSDKSERLIGYFTKWGDAAADIFPIADLYKSQVRKIALDIGIPRKIAEKPSSPGLWRGHRAEEEIGLGYDVIDPILYAMEELNIPPSQVKKIQGVRPEDVDKVVWLMEASRHKKITPYPCIQERIRNTIE